MLPARMLKSMSGSGSMPRLPVPCPVDLGGELEEQAELTDLDGLLHDVHAVEVVEDDRFQDEVARGSGAAATCASTFGSRENFSGRCFWPSASRSSTKRLHALQAGFVERLQDIERGEQERAGAAGRVEDGRPSRWRARRRAAVPGPSQFSITSWANWRMSRLG